MTDQLARQIAFDHFTGKASPLQQRMLAQWLQPDAHREQYLAWLEEWERHHPQFLPDADAAYQRVWAQRQPAGVSTNSIEEPTPLGRAPRLLRRYWLAAGVALVLVAGGYFGRDSIRYRQYQSAYGQVETIRLADGSRVTLNANSRLRVPRWGFGQGTRQVWLTGEAEFSVRHLPGHQRFIVRTPDQLEVLVLGTEFVVYSRARGSKIVLKQGRVQLRSLRRTADQPLLMVPGDIVTSGGQSDRLVLRQRQSIVPHVAWKEQRFVLDNTTVAEVADRLTEQFGVRVLVADTTLAQRRLGGTFRARSATELLEALADILNVRVTQPDENSYLLHSTE